MPIDSPDRFEQRHIGPDDKQQADMLRVIGMRSLDALIDAALPRSIRLKKPLQLPPAESEHEYLDRLRTVAAKNQRFKSYIGMGYYPTITPSVILRCLFENPSWYTPYTPYQAEIAQGRLESLLNFQTMVKDLTGMEIATASLLDEATAAGEAMTLLHRVQARNSAARNTFWVSERTYPQVLDVLRGRAEPLGINIVMGDPASPHFGTDIFGAFAQSPDDYGALIDLREFIARAHAQNVLVAVATDLLALTISVPPGEMGADVVVGSAQRFGVPMGYGGPHAAFLATREAFVRQAPGRIIGVSIDATWQPRLPDGAADARTTHPPRKSDVEHLYRTGAARQYRGDVRGVSRPRRADRDRQADARPHRDARTGRAVAGLYASGTRRISTRSASRCPTASARLRSQ